MSGKILKRKFTQIALPPQFEKWKDITSDKYILDIVQNGLMLNFGAEPPEKGPFEYKRSKIETDIIDKEVEKLLRKEVISACEVEDGDYFSSLFTREKKDGSYRTILNLKYLNEECETHHFKMESLKQAMHMMPGMPARNARSIPSFHRHQRCVLFGTHSSLSQEVS